MIVSSVGAPAVSNVPNQKSDAALVGLSALCAVAVALAWLAAAWMTLPMRPVTAPVSAEPASVWTPSRSLTVAVETSAIHAPVRPLASGSSHRTGPMAPGRVAMSDRRQDVNVCRDRAGLPRVAAEAQP